MFFHSQTRLVGERNFCAISQLEFVSKRQVSIQGRRSNFTIIGSNKITRGLWSPYQLSYRHITEASNDGFLLNILKTLFTLSIRVF